MNRPDSIAMHTNARRYRSRLMAWLLRRLLRRVRIAMRPAERLQQQPARVRYPMPQQ